MPSEQMPLLPRLIAACVLISGVSVFADELPLTSDDLRPAIQKSLPLLMKAAVGHRENRDCFACHNQGIPILALTAAGTRGFDVDMNELGIQQKAIVEFLASNREEYLRGEGQGGKVDTAGYALTTLEAAGWKADETTAAVTEYLLLTERDLDHWLNTSRRPPSEATPFTTTYVALRSLSAYGTPDQQRRIDDRRAEVLGWLLRTPPGDSEERVFRLLGLKAAGAQVDIVSAAAKDLTAAQQDDGGWSQLDAGEPETAVRSDAYATGTALVALQLAGELQPSDAVIQRGLRYLLKTQQDDGSWHVISRSKPFQTYFETGFPHGKDQFISCSASAWATLAMVNAVEPVAPPPPRAVPLDD